MADISQTISNPGDINVLRLELQTASGKLLDITGIVPEISIFEDIFSNSLSGHLIVEDALDLINTLPLVGQELLHIELQTPTLTTKIKKTFYVYKLQNVIQKKRSMLYTLNFCSVEMISSLNSKVSKSFSGNISDTVSSIFKDQRYLNSTENLETEKTKNIYSFIAPYWSPFQTINWLTNKSINSRDVSNFLFYENASGFKYKSVDSLLASTATREYIYSDVPARTSYDDLDSKYNIVQSLDMPVTFDYIRNLSAGMYGSTLYTLDLTSKQIKSNTYSYINDFNKTNHTNKAPLKTNGLIIKNISDIHFLSKNDYRTGNYKPQDLNKTLLQRNSLLEQIRAFKFTITVLGRTDIRAGDMIKYRMPKMTEVLSDKIETEIDSEYFSGKYLITAIHHRVINGKHSMEMEIVSDSFIKNITV